MLFEYLKTYSEFLKIDRQTSLTSFFKTFFIKYCWKLFFIKTQCTNRPTLGLYLSQMHCRGTIWWSPTQVKTSVWIVVCDKNTLFREFHATHYLYNHVLYLVADRQILRFPSISLPFLHMCYLESAFHSRAAIAGVKTPRKTMQPDCAVYEYMFNPGWLISLTARPWDFSFHEIWSTCKNV
jgi:hypothetical protein